MERNPQLGIKSQKLGLRNRNKEVRKKSRSLQPAAHNKTQHSPVEPNGPGGRVLKEDVLRKPEPPERAPVGRAEAPTVASGRPSKPVGREEEVVPMSRLRRTVAERLVAAQHAAALLTTFNEVDMTN